MGDVVGQAVTIKRGVDVAEKEGVAVVVGYAEITNKGVEVAVSVWETEGAIALADGESEGDIDDDGETDGVTDCEKVAPTKERMLSI